MKSKIIAVMAVLALAFGPLLVVVDTDADSDTTTIDLHALEEDKGATFWVKGGMDKVVTKEETYFKFVIEMNNDIAEKDKVYVNLQLTGIKEDYRFVELKGDFCVNEKCFIEICEKDVRFNNLTVNGTIKQGNGNGRLVSTTETTASQQPTIQTFSEKDNNTICGIIDNVNVSLNGCILWTYKDLKNSPVQTVVTMKNSKLYVNNQSTFTDFCVNGDICIDDRVPDGIKIGFNKELSMNFNLQVDKNVHTMGIYYLDDTFVKINWGVDFSNVALSSNFAMDSVSDKITLTGAIETNVSPGWINDKMPNIDVKSGNDLDVVMNDLSLKGMIIGLLEFKGNLYFGSNTGEVDYVKDSNEFLIQQQMIDEKRIRSASTDSVKVSFPYATDNQEGTVPVTYSDTVNNEGKSGFDITLIAGEGIKKIDQKKLFVEDGKTVDLTKVKVTYKENYQNVKWFYKDASGKYCEITNPAAYAPTGEIDVYAIAEYVEPEPGPEPEPGEKGGFDIDGFTIISLVIVMLVIAGVGYAIVSSKR